MSPARNATASAPPSAHFARGSYGDLIGVLQTALAGRGYYTGGIDEDFGGGTERAVLQFQRDARHASPDGRIDPAGWATLTGTDWPDLFERALQVTARFEGHGYGAVAGNFDGAGLTWGIIGFTLANGEIGRLLREIALRDPQLIATCFGPLADQLARMLELAPGGAAQQRWADRISLGASKYTVAPDWREAFMRLGSAPLARVLQREAAWRRYYVPAEASAARLGLTSDLGLLLAFDTHVQNGGVKTAVERDFLQASRDWPPADQRRRREDLAARIAASAKPRWRADVLARKQALATSRGVVHGAAFDLSAWGVDID